MFDTVQIPFSDIPQFSDRDKAYQEAHNDLRPFYEHQVNIESFDQVFKNRKNYEVDRSTLVSSLHRHYSDMDTSKQTFENIESLASKNTFTIVTAHQPSLLSGPLYFIYKICSTISLARSINENYPQYKVVPVFVLGGEDHDFEEIATLKMFGKEFTWETDQVGATGRMTLDGLETVINDIIESLGNSDNASMLKSIISEALQKSQNYGNFMMRFVNALFKEHGLVICNMDDESLKKSLLPFVVKDIESLDSQKFVQQDQEALEKRGFKRQAHVREVNIFVHDNNRNRVVAENGNYKIGDSTYSKSQLIDKLENNVGAISPNVILRPVYQEIVLPNLAYIGGGGELAYWLERKSLFGAWDIPFPMLIRRDSALIVDRKTNSFLIKSELDINVLFQREEKIAALFARHHAEVEIDFREQREQLQAVFGNLAQTAKMVDATLERTVMSEESKMQKSIDMIENKLLKAEKQKNEVGLNKLKKIKSKFFPGNDGLQERNDNMIPYYLKYGSAFIDFLVENLDPLNKNFKVFVER